MEAERSPVGDRKEAQPTELPPKPSKVATSGKSRNFFVVREEEAGKDENVIAALSVLSPLDARRARRRGGGETQR